MENLRIKQFTEDDFTELITQAGGKRAFEDDSRQKEKNADYLLGNSIIELKLVSEEGFEKQSRQKKLAQLFSKENKAPVVVLDPNNLEDQDKRKYYNIVELPLENHIKKANKQLRITESRFGKKFTKILLIVNNGYGTVLKEEFKSIVLKRIQNNTSHIDHVIIAGMYCYSDGFNNIFLPEFESHAINLNSSFDSWLLLKEAWGPFLDKFMNPLRLFTDKGRLTIQDLSYIFDGTKYVKPVIKMGGDSDFFPNGRPRKDTTGLKTCPSVAIVAPKLILSEWERFKTEIFDDYELEATYAEWTAYWKDEVDNIKNLLKPLVQVAVTYEEVKSSIKSDSQWAFNDIKKCASDKFNKLAVKLIERAEDKSKFVLQIPSLNNS